jgi:hypothetical protein
VMREARRLELIRANEVLLKVDKGNSGGNTEWDPFAEDERPVSTGKLGSLKVSYSIRLVAKKLNILRARSSPLLLSLRHDLRPRWPSRR